MIFTTATARDFLTFQREFKRYQKLLGLNGYKVFFEQCPLNEGFASIAIDQLERVATARLNSRLPATGRKFLNPKAHAKHEALHLLIYSLEHCGRERWGSLEAIYEASEELVRRLEGLIP